VKPVDQFLHNPANKQTNTDENITSLAEVIKIYNYTRICEKFEGKNT